MLMLEKDWWEEVDCYWDDLVRLVLSLLDGVQEHELLALRDSRDLGLQEYFKASVEILEILRVTPEGALRLIDLATASWDHEFD